MFQAFGETLTECTGVQIKVHQGSIDDASISPLVHFHLNPGALSRGPIFKVWKLKITIQNIKCFFVRSNESENTFFWLLVKKLFFNLGIPLLHNMITIDVCLLQQNVGCKYKSIYKTQLNWQIMQKTGLRLRYINIKSCQYINQYIEIDFSPNI